MVALKLRAIESNLAARGETPKANVPAPHRKGLHDLNSNQNLASGAAAGAGCCGVSWL